MKRKVIALAMLFAMMLGIAGCGSASNSTPEASVEASTPAPESAENTSSQDQNEVQISAPEIPGLVCERAMDLDYAQQFAVYYYSDGYKLIDVIGDRQYLLIPDGKGMPDGAADELIPIQLPLENVYLAATSAMALIDAIGEIGVITMTGTQQSGWYVPGAIEAMSNGNIVYAGKYSEPDYELMVSNDCKLAIESTMILHAPKVQEMIELLDIPVFIDRSSYEVEPLGRSEWIKLYAAMLDKEQVAEEYFREQEEVLSVLDNFENTGVKVAFFSVNTDGSVVVRNSSDYIASMINNAGAVYAFNDLVANSASVTITMEEFYATAMDADYLIYNASIEEVLNSIDELVAKDELFASFKAVKEGNVWTTGKDMYQSTDRIAMLTLDVNHVITDGDENQMVFLSRVK